MLITLIVIVLVVFTLIVCAINWPRIKSIIFEKKTHIKPQKKDYDKEFSKSALSYEDVEIKKSDNLNREVKGEPFLKASETELSELKNNGKSEKKLRDEKKKTVVVENLGEFEAKDAFEGDDLRNEYDSDIAEQIKELSPEMKALLLSNVLNKRDDI